ncbi:APC family permease [Rhodococcoides yunnanense]|uniref:APC family permease n=1 Tax=Rhodococcoides yunnanense TaxID=278209 RepID=A0ABU4BIE9_9NOCA|nr:APC family permease [Rhodococcus yunnanensis]MDV6263982.1 APC family permease [Rhodococcus yunnanensis]
MIYMVPIAPVAVFGVVYYVSSGMTVLVYLVGALAMTFSAISYREMAKSPTTAGSVYAYVRHGIGQRSGFVAGWMILLDYLIAPAFLYVLLGVAMHSQFPGVSQEVWIVAGAIVVTAVNLMGVTVTVRASILILIIQMVLILTFLVFAIIRLAQGDVHLSWTPLFDSSLFSFSTIGNSLPIVLFAYIGFDVIAVFKAEAIGGSQTVARATTIVMVAMTALFAVEVYAASLFVPAEGFSSEEAMNTAFYDISAVVVGDWFRAVLAFVVGSIVIIANAAVSQAGTGRVLVGMARDSKLPKVLAYVSPRNGVPVVSVLAVALISLTIALGQAGRLEFLTTVVTFGAVAAYVMLHAAVIWGLGRNSGSSIFAHRISPVLGSGILIYALWSASTDAKILGLTWLAVGIIIALSLGNNSPELDLADPGSVESAG